MVVALHGASRPDSRGRMLREDGLPGPIHSDADGPSVRGFGTVRYICFTSRRQPDPGESSHSTYVPMYIVSGTVSMYV